MSAQAALVDAFDSQLMSDGLILTAPLCRRSVLIGDGHLDRAYGAAAVQ